MYNQENFFKETKINSIKILYQDEFIIIIEKPSGLLSVSYEGNHSKTALQQIENKKYEQRLLSMGVNKIYKYGIAFKGKECKIKISE